jgi:hypothetical protein
MLGLRHRYSLSATKAKHPNRLDACRAHASSFKATPDRRVDHWLSTDLLRETLAKKLRPDRFACEIEETVAEYLDRHE